MKWLDLLSCPQCRAPLTLEAFLGDSSRPQEGVLLCSGCSHWFPVRGGIPRVLLPGPLRADDSAFVKEWSAKKPGPWTSRAKTSSDKAASERKNQAQVQDAFAFKWKRQSDWGVKGETASFMEEWIFKKYGWNNAKTYTSFLQDKRICLDAGAGLGREALRMAKASPKSTIVALELSACVEEAKAHADRLGLTNIVFVQGDLTAPPLKAGIFDFIFSEGVLHHTPSTHFAFQSMAGLLSKKGEIAFYIYRTKAPLREYADDYVRAQLQNIPLEEAWKQMEPLTLLGKTLADKKLELEIAEDVPVLGIQKGRFDLQRWIYNTVFKCFWNDSMSFQENVLINFDWYLPKFAWRHREEEVRGWLKDEGLKLVHEFIEDAGITTRAVKA